MEEPKRRRRKKKEVEPEPAETEIKTPSQIPHPSRSQITAMRSIVEASRPIETDIHMMKGGKEASRTAMKDARAALLEIAASYDSAIDADIVDDRDRRVYIKATEKKGYTSFYDDVLVKSVMMITDVNLREAYGEIQAEMRGADDGGTCAPGTTLLEFDDDAEEPEALPVPAHVVMSKAIVNAIKAETEKEPRVVLSMVTTKPSHVTVLDEAAAAEVKRLYAGIAQSSAEIADAMGRIEEAQVGLDEVLETHAEEVLPLMESNNPERPSWNLKLKSKATGKVVTRRLRGYYPKTRGVGTRKKRFGVRMMETTVQGAVENTVGDGVISHPDELSTLGAVSLESLAEALLVRKEEAVVPQETGVLSGEIDPPRMRFVLDAQRKRRTPKIASVHPPSSK